MGSKGGRCLGLTTLQRSCADCLEMWESQSPGYLSACTGLNFLSIRHAGASHVYGNKHKLLLEMDRFHPAVYI